MSQLSDGVPAGTSHISADGRRYSKILHVRFDGFKV